MRYRICEADFETTTDPADCRVWAWAVAFVDGGTYYGTDIDSFFAFMSHSAGAKCYFHNLAFDGKFIVDRIMRLGYAHTTEPNPQPGQFTTLVSRMGKFYSVTIRWHNGVTTYIYDSLKLFPMSVRRVAKTFDMPEQKGELDYDEYRPVGHELTDEERDYIRRDVEIMAAALAFNEQNGLRGMTVGANAMADFRKRLGKSAYKNLFPVIDPEIDAFLRKAYKGGFTYVSPDYAGADVGPGISVDYNSMYPSMLISKAYPVGPPFSFEGRYEPDTTYPLYVQALTCEFHVKPHGVPMVQLRGMATFGQHEYVTDTIEPVPLVLTSVDLEQLFVNYDVDVWSWDGGYKFQARDGAEIFGDYVEHWGEVKRTSTGGMRQLAKLMLNNLYGKFATNPDVTQKVPRLDPETDHVVWETGEEESRDAVYVPLSAFCTAYARDTLIRAIHANRERFVYCDTDSMHLLGTAEPDGIRLHDTDFCAWKVEGEFSRARHLRAKCYIWDLNGEISVTCAGMPDNIKAHCTFDNFRFGFSNLETIEHEDGTCEVRVRPGWGKLLPKAVPGGIVLVESPYELKE